MRRHKLVCCKEWRCRWQRAQEEEVWIQKSKNEEGAFLGGETAKVTVKNLRER